MLVAFGAEEIDGKERAGEGIDEIEFEGTEINDWHDLSAVRDDLSGYYILMSDLNTETAGYDELVDTEDGWEPIGDYDHEEDVEFIGTFDGNGHQISHLYINRSEMDNVGLFGYLGSGAKVTDVGLVDVEVYGEYRVGALAGSNRGTVENSYATGEVNGQDRVGALVGFNFVTVSNSYAAGNVTGGSRVGGLIGDNYGTIENSYATTAVAGDSVIGGLVGNNDGTVSNSYATGDVSGFGVIGGLVGYDNDGTVSDSYWDIETSGIDTSEGGTGLTTDEMIGENATNNMFGFDFEEIWETVEESHEDADEDGYPILQGLTREEQIKHVYPAEVEDDIIDELIDELEDIPGFTSTFLLLAAIIAVAVCYKKR